MGKSQTWSTTSQSRWCPRSATLGYSAGRQTGNTGLPEALLRLWITMAWSQPEHHGPAQVLSYPSARYKALPMASKLLRAALLQD